MNFTEYASSANTIVDAGKYEVVLSASIKKTKDGSSDYLQLMFRIRDDVNQKYNDGSTAIFHKIYRDKNDNQWFDLPQVASILFTQKDIRTDFHTEFSEVDELIQYINGISLAVDVTKEYDEYFEQETNKVKFARWNSPYHKTEHGQYVPKQKTVPTSAPVTANTEKVAVNEEDLPF